MTSFDRGRLHFLAVVAVLTFTSGTLECFKWPCVHKHAIIRRDHNCIASASRAEVIRYGAYSRSTAEVKFLGLIKTKRRGSICQGCLH